MTDFTLLLFNCSVIEVNLHTYTEEKQEYTHTHKRYINTQSDNTATVNTQSTPLSWYTAVVQRPGYLPLHASTPILQLSVGARVGGLPAIAVTIIQIVFNILTPILQKINRISHQHDITGSSIA